MMHLPADNIAGFADSHYWSSSSYINGFDIGAVSTF
jgi:hypothetical protein|tara:strand:+ start:327 stop:434 length:108 start_codon:yes stop_codon:yes gene_type:complete